MQNTTTIRKRVNGISYYSNKIDTITKHRFWESVTHPNYKHFTKSKTID